MADTASGSASNTRSKPLETKKSSSGKPLQKVAPVYVKKVVAEIVTSVDQIEGQGKIELYRVFSFTLFGSDRSPRRGNVLRASVRP